MKKTNLLLASSFLLLTVVLSGCGYTTRSMIASKYRTIYVQPFVNKIDITNEAYSANKYRIYRPLLESDVTKKVINKYLFDGNLKPVKESKADVILKGELIDFRKDPLRYDQSDNVAEYRINIVLNISLWDRASDTLIWEENGFTGDYSFFTSGSQATSEDSAVTKALDDLARRVVERTVEQW
ncbi:MAG: LptE family protein [Candidatus Omnitrophica bacterium]|nr:LptE family protein [Candidatus Omnitrophota bacterium]